MCVLVAIWLVLEGLFYVHRIYLLHKVRRFIVTWVCLYDGRIICGIGVVHAPVAACAQLEHFCVQLNATNHPLPEDDVQQRLAQFRTLVGVVDMKEVCCCKPLSLTCPAQRQRIIALMQSRGLQT